MTRRTQRATALALSALLLPALAGCVLQPGGGDDPDTTFTDADDFLAQYGSDVETCEDTQTQDVEELVGSQAEAIGLGGATMGTCVVDTSGNFAAGLVLSDPTASVEDIESAAPGFLKGLLDGSQGDTVVLGGNWVVFGKGFDSAAVIDEFGGETVNP